MNKQLSGNIGEIVSWTSPKSVSIDDLRDAMIKAAIDTDMAKDMAPSNAFRRAIHKLEDNRVIRQTKNEKESVYFQFTAEHLSGGEFHYSKECEVRLDKKTGRVHCTDSTLRTLAQHHIDNEIKSRGAADVTRIVQKMFDDSGDLFPLRDAGGVYFVPEIHKSICESVEILLTEIGGSMKRWEMGASTRNTQNAAVAVRDTIMGMVVEYREHLKDLKSDDENKMAKAVQKINTIRFKLDAYGDVLDSYKDDVANAIKDVGSQLRKLTGETTEDEPPQEVRDGFKEATPKEEAAEPKEESATDILQEMFGI
ncbi:MAG: hypothetical protein GY826_12580 [Fuerstiella sp.]|nr:hypothetical protein [Fuerstiella sp.]